MLQFVPAAVGVIGAVAVVSKTPSSALAAPTGTFTFTSLRYRPVTPSTQLWDPTACTKKEVTLQLSSVASNGISRGGAADISEKESLTLGRRLELLDISLAEFIRTFPVGERLLELKAKVGMLQGLNNTEADASKVEEQAVQSKIGALLSIVGALVAVVSVTMLGMGKPGVYLSLDAASLLIAGIAILLSSTEWANILNRGVFTLGLVLGLMHILTM